MIITKGSVSIFCILLALFMIEVGFLEFLMRSSKGWVSIFGLVALFSYELEGWIQFSVYWIALLMSWIQLPEQPQA